MNTKMTATLAVAIVAVMVFAAVGSTTYSWFSDSDESEIEISTGVIKVDGTLDSTWTNGSSGNTQVFVTDDEINITKLVADRYIPFTYAIDKSGTTIDIRYRLYMTVSIIEGSINSSQFISIAGTNVSGLNQGDSTLIYLTDKNGVVVGFDQSISTINTSIVTPAEFSSEVKMKIKITLEAFQADYVFNPVSINVSLGNAIGSGLSGSISSSGIPTGSNDVVDVGIELPASLTSHLEGYSISASEVEVDDIGNDTFVASFNGSIIGAVDYTISKGTDEISNLGGIATVSMTVKGYHPSVDIHFVDSTIVEKMNVISNEYDSVANLTTITFVTSHFSSFVATIAPIGTINGVAYTDGTEFVNAIKNADVDSEIVLLHDFTGNITIVQKPGVEITFDGNDMTFAGVITVDGRSSDKPNAVLSIKNVVFRTDGFTNGSDACIRLGISGDNSTRYTYNVTVDNCIFDVPNMVGVKSYTGGDHNLKITGCTATSKAHSLVQVANIEDGLVIENCDVNSKNGINVNQTAAVTIKDCTFDVKGYAVRFGASSGGSAVETYLIENCTMKSACEDNGDAVIILRGTAKDSTLTINSTSINGTPGIITVSGAKVIVDEKDAISTIDDLRNACANGGDYILRCV